MTTHPTPGRQRPNNHQRGAALEETLKWQHNIYNAQNRAWVWQNGTKGIIRKGQTILLPSLPDFGGILTSMGGKYVSFDAKMTSKAYYSHPGDRLHQLSTLWTVQESGGVSFLLVSIELERFYLLWPQIGWRDQRPYSVRLDKLRPDQGIEFERGGSNRLPEWLGTIERIYECDGVLPGARNQGSK